MKAMTRRVLGFATGGLCTYTLGVLFLLIWQTFWGDNIVDQLAGPCCFLARALGTTIIILLGILLGTVNGLALRQALWIDLLESGVVALIIFGVSIDIIANRKWVLLLPVPIACFVIGSFAARS